MLITGKDGVLVLFCIFVILKHNTFYITLLGTKVFGSRKLLRIFKLVYIEGREYCRKDRIGIMDGLY